MIISLIKFEIPCYDPDNIPDELKKLSQLNLAAEILRNFIMIKLGVNIDHIATLRNARGRVIQI